MHHYHYHLSPWMMVRRVFPPVSVMDASPLQDFDDIEVAEDILKEQIRRCGTLVLAEQGFVDA